MNRRILIACAAVLALGTPTAAQAAPTWLAPTKLEGANNYGVQAAMSASGDTILAVQDTAHGAPYLASAAFRPAGGSTPTVAAVAPAAAGSSSLQDVAINGHGDAALAWVDTTSVWLALRPKGSGGFSAPILISPVNTIGTVQVAIDDAGAVVVAWIALSGGKQLTFFTVRQPDGTLGPISSSLGGQNATSPTLAVAPDGHAVVAWARTDGTHYVIQAATRAPGSTSFVATGDLSDSAQSADSPDAAIANGGHAAVTWARTDGTHIIVQVARRQGEGLFSTGLGISPTTVDSRYPTVAVNAAGQVAVSWTINVNEADVRVGSVTGDFEPRVAFPPPGGGQVNVALNDDGMGLVTWVGSGNGYASIMPPGGAFGAPIKINPDGTVGSAVQNVYSTTAGIDAEGNAVTHMQAGGSGNYPLYERLYDGAGPRLGGLSVPATATAGTSAAFAVAPLDVISSVASTSWSFGDGSPATSGTSVQHSFAAAGSYDVKVTSTDAVGNTSSATRKVTVAAVPVTPPPAPTPPQTLPGPKLKAPVMCKVPSLKNVTVTRAKSKLTSGHCKLGKVTTPRKLKGKKGLVVRSQSRKAGTSAANGTKVNVTLGTKPKPKKKARGR